MELQLIMEWIFSFPIVTDSDNIFPRQLSPEVMQALRGVRFIAQHIKDADKDNEVRNENGGFWSEMDQTVLIITWTLHSTSSDCSRLEIRLDGFGSFLSVGVHLELHWWHAWHHISKSIFVRYAHVLGPRIQRNKNCEGSAISVTIRIAKIDDFRWADRHLNHQTSGTE